jgi:1-acyl-sn-glycerol-3-phosphate acyltransferase
MAEMRPQTYKDPRPAEYFAQFHAAARTGVGWTYTFARIVLTLPTLLIYRVRAVGTENVPRQGALVLAPNHFSQMDHFFAGIYLRRKIRFMAKSQMFGPPVLTYIYKHGGVFPVRRGQHDEEAFKTAYQLLDQGEMLLVYAEGGRWRARAPGEAQTGIGRIGAGSARVRGWKRLQFPKVTVEFGKPMTFAVEPAPSRERQLEAATEIFAEVREMYDGLATRSEQRAGRRSQDRAPA